MRASSSVRENTAPPLYKRYETTNGYMWCVDHGMDTVLHKYWLVVCTVKLTKHSARSLVINLYGNNNTENVKRAKIC